MPEGTNFLGTPKRPKNPVVSENAGHAVPAQST